MKACVGPQGDSPAALCCSGGAGEVCPSLFKAGEVLRLREQQEVLLAAMQEKAVAVPVPFGRLTGIWEPAASLLWHRRGFQKAPFAAEPRWEVGLSLSLWSS